MAFQYFLYNTNYGNTIVDRSGTSFTPVPPYAELYTDYFIPETQPVYLYRVTGTTIIVNTQTNVDDYLNSTELPPTPEGNVTYGEFTGTTTELQQNINILSGTTLPNNYAYKAIAITGATNSGSGQGIYSSVSENKIQLKSLSAGTGISMSNTANAIVICSTSSGVAWGSITGLISNQTDLNNCLNSKVNKSGDTMTGTLCSTSNLMASGTVSGSSVCGSVWVHSPIICGDSCVRAGLVCSTGTVKGNIISGGTCSVSPITCGSTCLASPRVLGSISVCSPLITGSTKVCSPQVFGTTCISTPISCGTTCTISPIIIGSTCVCGPVILGSTSVCSPTVCASTSLCSAGTTKLVGDTTGSTLYLTTTPPTASITGSTVFWNAGTKQLQAFRLTGGTTHYYYRENLTNATTTTTTCQLYLGYCPTTFVAGRYQVDFSAQYGNSNSNGCSRAAFKIDNTIQGTGYLSRQQVNGWNSAISLSRDITLTAGTHCFDVYYWAGTNTACMAFASVRIKRIC